MQIVGGKVETVTDVIFLGSKITVDSDCSHEIKRQLLLGRKPTTNLDSMLKSRHHFVDKVLHSQSYGFSSSHVWMWELDHKEVWVLKDWCLSFELWCWKRPLRVPWTARSSQQSILKEINPEYSLEELMLKVKLQYFGLLMWRANSLGEKKQTNPDAGKDWRQEKRVTEDQLDRWHHWLNGHESE